MPELLRRKTRAEAEAVEGAYPFPVVATALASLAIGDVAIAVSMLLSFD